MEDRPSCPTKPVNFYSVPVNCRPPPLIIATAVRLRFGTGIGADELSFDRRQVNDALIGYCRSTGIPIPRGGAKSVRAEGEQIAMVIEPGTGRRVG